MRINPFASTVVAVAAIALTVGSALPASAAPTGDTVATFELTAGSLDIVVPGGPVDLGTSTPGAAAFTAQLGAVTVTDGRALADASWDSTFESTDFETGGGDTPSEVVTAADDVTFWSGPATSTTGNGTFTPGQANAGAAVAIDAGDAFTHAGGTGNNSATWNPTVIVDAPLDSEAGIYTATITHSVS